MHEDFMRRAIRLARVPAATSPNPRVGAVVVRDDEVVGEGYHLGPGTPHAERAALDAAGSAARGADLFVNLEPCAHHAHTPPCADAVIEAGVRRVFASLEDPDDRVRGRGLARLREAGIEVEVGLLEREAAEANRAFLHQRTTGKPLVTLKMALSIDGRMAAADGSSRWITGEEARRFAHERRAEVDAILIGAGTAVADNPRLTARGIPDARQPARVLIDGSGRVEASAQLFDEGEAIVVTTARCAHDRQIEWKEAGAEVLVLPDRDGHVVLGAVIETLAERGWIEILCEGGPSLSSALLASEVVDRLEIHRGSIVLGSGPGIGDVGVGTIGDAMGWDLADTFPVGSDVVSVYDRGTP
ncbi:MAG TPA: bifunctional diaminohydroxyphosphoribosylaminopyrimidine deaminase/5-amino-6-(5-phosphoribosylamino)uracil reductase RibD [Actinomycetota bacterium]|nr:bifunctional diaminohydroxyphosphoribosylaminopyrimidine deaminase/5-amino-6-(5-phosphoribosylamino)uracil reductase RibD [Actinomycetota bacterium]